MTPRKPIIYGPDGHPIVRARDRHAPKPRIGAGLEGWVSWGLIDRRGNKVAGGEQHNLILDTFLDRLAASDVYANAFLSHFAVGTGSTPPDVTDTALDNELARTTTSITSSTTRVANGVHERIWEREFDFGVGNGNLTEFGFGYGVSSDMLVRELFRDGGGNPVTLTKTADYKLRIKYTLSVALTPVTLTSHSFPITGIGLINGQHTWIGSTFSDFADSSLFSSVARGQAGPWSSTGNAWCSLSTVSSISYTSNINRHNTNTPGGGVNTSSAYTPGSHQRSISMTIPTSGDNIAANSIVVGTGDNLTDANRRVGWGFLIDSNDRFTKDSLHTLSLDEVLTVAWGRA